MSKKRPTAIDLFSGCGGFSFGLQESGFDVLLGVDNDPIALKTFEMNHKNSKTLLLDLSEKASINKIVNSLGQNKVDIIVGGPPCQGFSLTGTRNSNDKRNVLFYAVFDLAKKLNPSAIIIENVPGISTLYNGKVKNEIDKCFALHGYESKSQVLVASEYGVPQIRKRMFFVGVKKGLAPFNFPKPTTAGSNYINCQQAIGDLPALKELKSDTVLEYKKKPMHEYQRIMRKGSRAIHNHVATKHTELVIDVISQVPEGGNYKDLPPGVGLSRTFNEAWTRYHSKKPSKTIDTGHRNHFHYKWNRIPTVRENARLQSFPDKFIILGNRTQQYRQVGNAVPPLLGQAIGRSVKKIL